MKTIVKLICASSFALMLAFSCAKVAEEQITFSSDPTALTDVPCKDPADQVLNLTTNANWIVVTPQWVKADPVFGSGNAIVSFKVESTYINDKTDVAPRSGEIVFSGGGKSYVVPISQLGYTVPFDPSAGIGGIPDVDEFLKFVQAVNENEGMALSRAYSTAAGTPSGASSPRSRWRTTRPSACSVCWMALPSKT